jgi:IS5 family transposase
VITDAEGIPLVVQTGPANERDDARVEPMLQARPRLFDQHGHLLVRPKILQGDAGYGFSWTIAAVIVLGIIALFKPRTKRGEAAVHGSGMGKTRYVVERTLAWFSMFRRIRVCYERTGQHFQAFHELAACVICARRLKHARRRF